MRESVSRSPNLFFRFVWLLLLSITAISCRDALPPCEDSVGCINIRPNDPIQIAYLLSLSGETAVIGEDALRGIELALDRHENEILGHEIQLLGFDAACRTQAGEQAVSRMSGNDSLVGIIGPICSDVARAVMPMVDEQGFVLISPSATAPDLTDAQPVATALRHNSFFRTAPNNLMQAQVAATYAYEMLGKRTAVTVHDGTAYARSLQQQFSQTFQRLGGSIIFQGSVTVGDTAVEDLLSELIAEQPDLFYMPVFEPEANLIALRLLDLNDNDDMVLMGADSLLTPTFANSAESAVERMYLSGTAVRGPAYIAFQDAWDARYDTDPIGFVHAYAYDAVNLLLDAVNRVAISSNNGSLLIGRQALRNAIAATVAFPGVTGSLSCEFNGDCAAISSIGIYELRSEQVSGKVWPPAIVWNP